MQSGDEDLWLQLKQLCCRSCPGAGDGPRWVNRGEPVSIKTNLGTPASIKALKESVMLRHRLACSVRAELNRMVQMTPTVAQQGAMAAEVELLNAVLNLLMTSPQADAKSMGARNNPLLPSCL